MIFGKCIVKGPAPPTRCHNILGYVHTIQNSFSRRHEKLFDVVWTPVQYVILFWDRCSAVQCSFALLQKSRRNLTVFMCEPISDTVWFSCRRKSNLIECEHSLDNSARSWKFFKCYEPYQGQALRFFLVAYMNACIAEQKIIWNMPLVHYFIDRYELTWIDSFKNNTHQKDRLIRGSILHG